MSSEPAPSPAAGPPPAGPGTPSAVPGAGPDGAPGVTRPCQRPRRKPSATPAAPAWAPGGTGSVDARRMPVVRVRHAARTPRRQPPPGARPRVRRLDRGGPPHADGPPHARPSAGSGTPAGAPGRLPPPLAERPDEGGRLDPAVAHAVEVLSHELRSPITTISLAMEVLHHDGAAARDPLRTEVIEAAEAEADRLHHLVEDLLAVARHAGGAARLPVGPLLLQRWLPGALDAERGVLGGTRLRVHLEPGLPPVLADDAALAQVLRNLLSNAARFGGGLPVELVADARPGRVGVRVLDRGVGIDPDEAERLFEPFYRSRRTEGTGAGAGLGLAAARELALAMGATLAARPREGGGSELELGLALAGGTEDEDSLA